MARLELNTYWSTMTEEGVLRKPDLQRLHDLYMEDGYGSLLVLDFLKDVQGVLTTLYDRALEGKSLVDLEDETIYNHAPLGVVNDGITLN